MKEETFAIIIFVFYWCLVYFFFPSFFNKILSDFHDTSCSLMLGHISSKYHKMCYIDILYTNTNNVHIFITVSDSVIGEALVIYFWTLNVQYTYLFPSNEEHATYCGNIPKTYDVHVISLTRLFEYFL